MTNVLGPALAQARQGGRVFPLKGKKPITRNGFKDATTDADQIKAWFEGRDDLNVGLVIPDGHYVLDVDPRNGGDETWEAIRDTLPPTRLVAETGGGGRHYWYRGEPNDFDRLPGIDVKKAGKGYVVMPPSVHPDTGKAYMWKSRGPAASFSGPLRYTPPNQPEDLHAKLGLDRQGNARELAESDEPILLHSQHESLMQIAAYLLGQYPEPIARSRFEARLDACVPEHPQREAQRIWEWALEKQANGEGLVESDEEDDAIELDVDEDVPAGGREELKRLRARNWAMTKQEEAVAGKLPLPTFKTAKELLDEPEPPLDWRVEQLLPVQSVAVLHAGAKVGKSHFIGHLVHSLLTGAPFLGEYTTEPTDGNVVLIDLELSERVLRAWSQKFDNKSDRLRLAALRGQSRAMDVLSDAHFERVVRAIKAQKPSVLIIDPLGPMLGARGIEENDNGAVRTLLDRLMALKERTGAEEMIVSHHAGHGGTGRTRGASVFLDWPDVLIGLRRKDEKDPFSPRILNAYGRDVSLPETELEFDRITQVLMVKREDETPILLHIVTSQPGLQLGEIHRQLVEAGAARSTDTLRRELAALVSQGTVREETLPAKGSPKAFFPA